MDVRNLIFPMTVGDLVQSACIVACTKRGDGVELHLLEVVNVDATDHWRHLTVRDRVTLERSDLTLDERTPILVSGISR